MDAILFLAAFWLIVFTFWILRCIARAFDRHHYAKRNLYSDVPNRHRQIKHGGFKSRQGIRDRRCV